MFQILLVTFQVKRATFLKFAVVLNTILFPTRPEDTINVLSNQFNLAIFKLLGSLNNWIKVVSAIIVNKTGIQ